MIVTAAPPVYRQVPRPLTAPGGIFGTDVGPIHTVTKAELFSLMRKIVQRVYRETNPHMYRKRNTPPPPQALIAHLVQFNRETNPQQAFVIDYYVLCMS